MNKVTAYIIAYNQAEKIRDCINSVQWADEIVLIDSHSTDGTAEIARELGAKVVDVKFEGFGKLRNSAIENCHTEWIFSLDSDERCTPEARDAILEIVHAEQTDHDYYFVPRRNFFLGRWIKHNGWYPNYRQPQLFRKGKMRYSLEPVHEGYVSQTEKPAGHLKADIWQVPFKDLEEVVQKMNRYSTLGVAKLAERHLRSGFGFAFCRACWAFFKHYILKRGFLDGWPGFIIAFGNFEGVFYRHAKYHAERMAWPEPKLEAPIHRKNTK